MQLMSNSSVIKTNSWKIGNGVFPFLLSSKLIFPLMYCIFGYFTSTSNSTCQKQTYLSLQTCIISCIPCICKPPCVQSPRSDPGVISISPSPLVYFLFHHSILPSFYWFYPWYFSTHSLLHSHCARLISNYFPSVLAVYWPKWYL